MKKLLFIILTFLTMTLFSQEFEKEDVKVGLVLSGGGAKGLAHVSALKVIEEAGVRIDYIGGTSMGAIIGALYASGYSANQLDSIVRVIDFDAVLRNKLPRKSKPFYEKEYGEKYALILPIRKRNVGIPKAISEGQNVLNLLTELTQNVNHIEDFNKLPIPFLCIATNLETGKQEILDNGFLPQAVKASGTFPTLLAPVEINGKLLVDGGVVNNFPVHEVKAMGADVIIGVDIQGGLRNKDELNSAPRILNQIVGFQMYKSLESKYKDVDYLIKPNLDDYSVISFDSAEEIMKVGDSVAQTMLIDLKKLAKRQTPNQKHKHNPSESKEFQISAVSIIGNENYTREYILGKLNLNQSDSTSYKTLKESIDNLSATSNFDIVQYEIDEAGDGDLLRIQVKENDVSNYLKLGIHYDKLYKTGVLLNLTSKHLLFKNDVFSGDLVLGDNLRYNINYFIDNGFYWSFGFRFRYNNFKAPIKYEEVDVKELSLQHEDFTNQAYVQTVFGRKFAIGAGVEYKRIVASTETVSDIDGRIFAEKNGKLYFDKSNYFNLFGFLKIDTYDKANFPNEGLFLDAGMIYYAASSDYNNNFEPFTQLKADFGVAVTPLENLTFQFFSLAGITIGQNENIALKYNVGGYGKNYINNFIPMYGYEFADLNADAFLKSGLTIRYEFLKKNYISFSGNYARVEDDLFNRGYLFENTISGYMAGYGLETFLGPVELNYSWSPDHEESYWYFNVGFWF